MNKSLIYFSLLISLYSFSACEEADSLTANTEAVLEGYIYANAPVENIRISSLIPFGTNLEDINPTSSLTVSFHWQNNDYLLEPMPGDSGYYHYLGTDLQILRGESYQISFDYNGKTIKASTLVPEKPLGLYMPKEEIEIAQIVFGGGGGPGGGFGGGSQPDPIEILWNNSEGKYHYIVVENIETNPESIFVNLPFERNFNFITEPTSSNVFLLQPRILEQYGTHRVVLYRVNQEYVNLYENREQDSRNLSEPLTNVENGLGVFTAFNSDTLYFEVSKQ